MIRTFKDKSSKQGIILVMVLLILAMAMIFISAAILLTNGTRNRLYDSAEKSQARLTATATAEAIWQAINIQEINDGMLEKMLGQKFILQMHGGDVPGTAAKDANNNYTEISVSSPTNVKETRYGVEYHKNVYIDVSTHIGDTVENVRMRLTLKDQPRPLSLFSNMMHSGKANQDQAQMNIGYHAGIAQPEDNNYVVVGNHTGVDLIMNRSNAEYWSNIILVGIANSNSSLDQNISLKANNSAKFHGDVVFLGENAVLIKGDSNYDFQSDSRVFFISSNSSNMTNTFTHSSNNSQSWGTNSVPWLFVNRTANEYDSVPNQGQSLQGGILTNKTNTAFLKRTTDGSGNPTYEWNSNGYGRSTNVSNWNSYSTDITNWINGLNTSYNSTGNATNRTAYQKAINNYLSTDFVNASDLPTTSAAFTAINKTLPDGEQLTTTGPSAKDIKMNIFMSKWAYGGSEASKPENGGYVAGGVYRFNEGGAKTAVHDMNSTPSTTQYVFLSGSESYTFYVASSYNMSGVVFCVLNPTKSTKVNFVLEEDVQILTMDGSGYSNGAAGGDYLCYFNTGFVSVSATKDNPDDQVKRFKGTDGSAAATTNYASYYPYTATPCIYVYGVNHNYFEINNTAAGGTVLEAYIGLYNFNYDEPTKYSQIKFLNQPFTVYGRTEAPKIEANTDSNKNTLPYCPPPPTESSIDYNSPLESVFKVVDIVYYGNATPS